MTTYSTDVLVIGAGPYGLSLSAKLDALSCDHIIVGRPMSFWREHMPKGMFLRSDWDWSLDPTDEFTILRFMEERGLSKADVTPFPIDTYLEYVDWFQYGKGVDPVPIEIASLDLVDGDRRFKATTLDGSVIHADRIVLALGIAHFANVPQEFLELSELERAAHTVDYVDLESARNERILIVGGRQSAFEWAALLGEAGARQIYMSHRHPSPVFEEADWTWVMPIVEGMVETPDWYRNLTDGEKKDVSNRLWREGRMKVEPWLEERIRTGPVAVLPETRIEQTELLSDGSIAVRFEDGDVLEIDRVVLATGYEPRLDKVPMVANGNLLSRIDQHDGEPILDVGFQTSVPGLYATGMLAAQSFGPFFGFTVACRASATIIGRALTTN